MFSKVSIKSFVYDFVDVCMFPNQEIQEIYQQYQVNKCYLYQNLTDTDSTSMFFVFICDLNSCVSENKARNIKVKYLIDLIYRQSFMSNLIAEMKTSKSE